MKSSKNSMPLPDTEELAEFLTKRLLSTIPTDWWDNLAKQVSGRIDVRAIQSDVASMLVARMPPEVFKGDY